MTAWTWTAPRRDAWSETDAVVSDHGATTGAGSQGDCELPPDAVVSDRGATAVGPGWRRLRDRLEAGGVVHAPGCVDALTARLVEQAGFDVAYLSGAVTSAVALGLPDLGFVGAADIADLGGRIARAVDLPLVADADTGYGNAVHAARTVRLYGAAGIAGLHLEDQTHPKRCGHMRGKDVIDAAEATQKIRAAVDASAGTTVIIARTDALSVLGLEAAIDRAGCYLEAGADLVFVEGAHDSDALAAIHGALPTARLVLNRSEAAGEVGHLDDGALASRGVALVIHPVSALLAMAEAARRTYLDIAGHGAARTERMTWADLNDTLGLPQVEDDQHRYA
jgi:2,3-dimethylmalate lyase